MRPCSRKQTPCLARKQNETKIFLSKITSKIPLNRYDECVELPIKIGDQEGCTLMLSQLSGKNTTADKNWTHCVTKTAT